MPLPSKVISFEAVILSNYDTEFSKVLMSQMFLKRPNFLILSLIIRNKLDECLFNANFPGFLCVYLGIENYPLLICYNSYIQHYNRSLILYKIMMCWVTYVSFLGSTRVSDGSSQPVGQGAGPQLPPQRRPVAVAPLTRVQVRIRAKVTQLYKTYIVVLMNTVLKL